MLYEIFNTRPDNRSYRESPLLVDNDTLVGIEIEVEGGIARRVNNATLKHWVAVGDGSLRDGIEFVTAGAGLAGLDVVEAIKEITSHLRKHEHTFSDRCSVHVHLDARTMTRQQVFVMSILWAYFEEMLFAVAGEWRSANIFCQSFARSNLANIMISLDKDDRNTAVAATTTGRYAAFNINSLAKHGTVEIRCHEGTSSSKRLLNWVNLLLLLRKFATTIATETVFDRILRKKNLTTEEVFGKLSSLLAVEDFDKREKMGRSNVLDIYINWQKAKETA